MLDRTLAREIETLVGDGSREAKFALLKRLDAAREDFSTPNILYNFGENLVKHGRAVTAICVAVTLDARRDRLDYWEWHWSLEIIRLLPANFNQNNLSRAYIDDDLHPTRICEYADSFINLTKEN